VALGLGINPLGGSGVNEDEDGDDPYDDDYDGRVGEFVPDHSKSVDPARLQDDPCMTLAPSHVTKSRYCPMDESREVRRVSVHSLLS